MDAISFTDMVFFVIVGAARMLWEDPDGFLLFIIRSIPHFCTPVVKVETNEKFLVFTFPISILLQRVWRPYDERPQFHKSSSTFEWMAVGVVKWALQTYHPNGPTQHIFSKSMSKSFHWFRVLRLGRSELGDATIEEKNVPHLGINGLWVFSPVRGDIHDVVVYYIHGGGFHRASTHFYTEYLLTMLVSLQMQGFRNPAIFALDYDHVPTSKVGDQIDQVARGWHWLTQDLDFDNVALAGDSNGGTLCLSLLLHIVHAMEGAQQVSTRQPACCVVVSPFTKLKGPWYVSDSDYVSARVLQRYMENYADNPRANATDPHVCPGLCHSRYWWSKAIPQRGGLFLMYGEDETLAGEVEELYQRIKDLGRVARDIEPNHVHAWPIVSMYIGRTKAERTRGVDKITNQIARMVLWEIATEPNEEVLIDLNKERYAINRYLQQQRPPGTSLKL